jgi:DNA-binding response OmpR family regulator
MSGGKIKFLLVEDEALNYLDIKQFLEDEGFGVLNLPGKMLIDNYSDALLVCENEIPHIAILDIQIKGEKDGLDIATYIRENYYSPVIILSGFDTDENLRRAAIIGIDGFAVKMEKPYNLKQLRAIIRLLLPLAQAAAKRRQEVIFLSVKDYSKSAGAEEIFILKRIVFDEIIFLKTIPGNKNSVLLELKNDKEENLGEADKKTREKFAEENYKKYITHRSLKEITKALPENFIRFSSDRIINIKFIDGKGKSSWVYYINKKRFEIAETYRTGEVKVILNKYSL